MHLYNLTLQKSSGITCAVAGNFTGSKSQEIAIARGGTLELYSVDRDYAKLQLLCSKDVHGVVRSIKAFRTPGRSKDYMILGGDSGKITVLEYVPSKNTFAILQQETFGRSGIRRAVPGQYLAVDPKGRAVMIAAVERSKFVYIFNRDKENRLTISSPLESHKSNTIIYDIIGLDVGYENPVFASLEMDFEDADNDSSGEAVKEMRQNLTFYEMDLGLNRVLRKNSYELEERANMLIEVPGNVGFPGGIVLCFENYISFRTQDENCQPEIRCLIPRRRNSMYDHDVMIVNSAVLKGKETIILIQTDQGDLFRLALECSKDSEIVTEMHLNYFDTVPVATSLCVLRSGMLFVASEFGNAKLYHIFRLQGETNPTFSSAMPLEKGDTFLFVPKQGECLNLGDELSSLNPIINSWMGDLTNEDSPQMYALCGQGPNSSLKVLRQGLEVNEMAVTELPGIPNGVWSLKKNENDEFHSYIVVSFSNATLVLSVGDTIEEVTDSGLLGTTSSLCCSQIGDDALIQVYAEAIRHVRKNRRVNEWKPDKKRTISNCVANSKQLVVALSGGELVYFEVDEFGNMKECADRKEMSADVTGMSLGPIPDGEVRSRFLGIGSVNSTLTVLSLDPGNLMNVLSVQILPSIPESICITKMDELYINVGLRNGILLKNVLDSATGELTDTRTRYLGARPVTFSKVIVQGKEAILSLSSRTWLSHSFQNRFAIMPLSYDAFDCASGFHSEQCSEGIVAIMLNSLRILTVGHLGTTFNQVSIPLRYTPRKLVPHPSTQNIIIIESDHNAITEDAKKLRKEQAANEMLESVDEDQMDEAQQMVNDFLQENLPEDVYGETKPGEGTWASVIRIVKPSEKSTVYQIPLDQNEAATSLCITQFANYPSEEFLIVGVQKDLTLVPRKFGAASLYAYLVKDEGQRFELVHKTPIDEVPNAICPFMGRILIGVGRFLRVYDLGKKKMLLKCENKHIPNTIVDIQCMGPRIVVADSSDSCHMLIYKKAFNQLIIFADDYLPRYTVRCCFVDYQTVAGSDKFGNVWVSRLPANATDDVEEDPTGSKAIWGRGQPSQKFGTLCSYYVGEMVTSIQKTSIIPGGSEVLLYTTIHGAIGMLAPFSNAQVYDFFQRLEMHMRNENPSLIGRDHLAFRSCYSPVSGVVDGDLCESFNLLEHSEQLSIGDDLYKTPTAISKNLENLRTKYAF